MDYRGQQIFIIHPDQDFREEMVRSLRYNEFETFGISETDADVISKRRDSVVFLHIADDEGWNWRDFADRIRRFEMPQRIVALGTASVELPEGFDNIIEYSKNDLLKSILSYLDEINRDALQKAKEHFNKATELEPDWAPPYAGLAKLFIFRAPRAACDTPFDALHKSVEQRQATLADYRPKAVICATET